MSKRKSQSPDIHALLQDGFSEETARELYAQGEEIAIFVMLQLAALAKKSVEVNGVHPSEPSGTVATYLKESAKQRRKKPGAKPGHQGSHRPPPENITHHVEHVAKCCPDFADRQKPRQSGGQAVFQEGFFGNFGNGLLGCVQRGRLRRTQSRNFMRSHTFLDGSCVTEDSDPKCRYVAIFNWRSIKDQPTVHEAIRIVVGNGH